MMANDNTKGKGKAMEMVMMAAAYLRNEKWMDMSFLFHGEVKGGEWHGRKNFV
jgi:hypothetical protein